MDILQNIVYPQSSTHIQLLEYLLFVTLLILLPYLSVMIGTTFFSVMHFSKGKRSGNRKHLIFSRELIDIFTVNKGLSFSLGIIPMLSIMLIMGQLLLHSDLNVNGQLFFALILLVIGLIYIYTFKYSFRLKNIFNLINKSDFTESSLLKEYEGLQKSNSKLLSKSGYIGLLLIAFAALILIGVLQIVADSSKWASDNSLVNILFSTNTILYFLFYLAFSFSITSAAIIFKYFKTESKKHNQDYLDFVKSFALKTGLIFTFIQPLLFVITVLSSPKSSLSFSIFIAVGIVLTFMLIVSIMFYIMYKESKTNLGGSTVLVFLILISVIIYKDQLAIQRTSILQKENLTKEYQLFATQIKEKAGITEIVEINGEDIYNAKCIACHRFDSQLVGPAYNSVLPKYEGKRADLVDFILNPRKINPELPAMPNQGLKPKEAEAIADYIVKTYQNMQK
ncbi:MAG: cytochrome c [Ignavibacteriales bacterium]|nr:cytochrome c [Ignavibacteriales bacterium]MCB9218873.1 cytochrome c [Ignavibacteriales bacterium]